MTVNISGTSGLSGVDGTAGTPALQGSDSNTGISFGTDTVNINTGGTTRATVDSSGRVLVGTSTSRTIAGDQASIQLETVGVSRASLTTNAASTAGAFLNIAKSRGSALNSKTVVSSGDDIGGVNFFGADGTNDVQAASITAAIDGTPGANDMPGRLVFSTTADGASSPTERLRIANDGAISSVIPGGSTLYPRFGCRAWVNFNGTGTVAIRASGNVSSITDNGIGDYTVTFTTAMPDANYCPVFCNHVRSNQTAGTSSPGLKSTGSSDVPNASLSTGSFDIIHRPASANSDPDLIAVAIFR